MESSGIRQKAEEWNAGSTKKVPYEFVEFCEGKRSVKASGKYCEWKKSLFGKMIIFSTTCEKNFVLSERERTIIDFDFCPYCGKKIKLVGVKENG